MTIFDGRGNPVPPREEPAVTYGDEEEQDTRPAPGSDDPKVVKVFKKVVNHWKGIMTVVMLLITVMMQAGFASFICEEKSQQLGFGVFALQEANLWPEAHSAVLSCIRHGQRDMKLYKTCQIFNPITGGVFTKYGEANLESLQWRLTAIESKLSAIERRVADLEHHNVYPAPTLSPHSEEKKVDRGQSLPVAEKIRPARQIDYRPNPGKEETRDLVYATQHGSCYHRKGCGSLVGKSQIRQMTEDDAIREGLRACRRCRP